LWKEKELPAPNARFARQRTGGAGEKWKTPTETRSPQRRERGRDPKFASFEPMKCLRSKALLLLAVLVPAAARLQVADDPMSMAQRAWQLQQAGDHAAATGLLPYFSGTSKSRFEPPGSNHQGVLLVKWVLVIASPLCVFLGLAAGPAGPNGNGTVTFREADPKQSGVTWVHDNAMSPQRYLPETEPPGVAIFDCNNDGCMDLLLVNTGESVFFHPKTPPHHALYRNKCDGTFADVTDKAGLTADLFAMGVAIGDYDGDG